MVQLSNRFWEPGLWYKKAGLFLLAFPLWTIVSAQSASPYRHQLTVQHDNDFVFAIDRYYTTGSFITYDRLLKESFFMRPTQEAPIQFQLQLGQQTFTPRELFETDNAVLERPYAGYLFSKASVSKASAKWVWQMGLEAGLAGPQSQAGALQVAYHELINEFIPVWADEIANSFHLNTSTTYFKDFKVARSNLLRYINWQSEAAIGTRTSYIKQGIMAYFGNRAAAYASSAFGRIAEVNEFYGFSGLSLRYVVNNALIEGHPFGDDSVFTLSAQPFVLQWDSGLRYRGQRMTYQLVYHWQTKETRREGRWHYISLAAGVRF